MTETRILTHEEKKRMRALRRARRYIRANEGALARLINTYQRVADLDPGRRYLPEH